MNLYEIAEDIAFEAHKGQTRRDGITPYITHPTEVEYIVTKYFSGYMIDRKRLIFPGTVENLIHKLNVGFYYSYDSVKELLRAIAISHDSIEDNKSITFSTFREKFKLNNIDNNTVNIFLYALNAITKRDEEKYLNYILRVKGNNFASVVKIADITHNLSTLDTKKDRIKIDKYEMARYILSN